MHRGYSMELLFYHELRGHTAGPVVLFCCYTLYVKASMLVHTDTISLFKKCNLLNPFLNTHLDTNS